MGKRSRMPGIGGERNLEGRSPRSFRHRRLGPPGGRAVTFFGMEPDDEGPDIFGGGAYPGIPVPYSYTYGGDFAEWSIQGAAADGSTLTAQASYTGPLPSGGYGMGGTPGGYGYGIGGTPGGFPGAAGAGASGASDGSASAVPTAVLITASLLQSPGPLVPFQSSASSAGGTAYTVKEYGLRNNPHAHHISAQTTENKGHRHTIQIFSFPQTGGSYDGHRHQYQGVTSFYKSHRHRFYGLTGPAIPLPDGTHYHTVSGTVYRNYENPFVVHYQGQAYVEGVLYSPYQREVHNHKYAGATGEPIGYEPPGW